MGHTEGERLKPGQNSDRDEKRHNSDNKKASEAAGKKVATI